MHLYNRTDVAGVTWTLRFETESNLDWGAVFLGKLEGMSMLPKWTLHATLPGQEPRYSSFHFYSVAERHDSQKIAAGIWHPRSASGTDLDCATMGMFIDDNEYGFFSSGSGLCLEDNLNAVPCTGEPSQFFYFENKTIKHAASAGNCLSIKWGWGDWWLGWNACHGQSNQSEYLSGTQSWYLSGTELKMAHPKFGDRCVEEWFHPDHGTSYTLLSPCQRNVDRFQWFFGYPLPRHLQP